MNLLVLRSLLLIPFLYASVSLASSYTIEIIVFEHTGANTSAGELWTHPQSEWALQPKVGQSNITPLSTGTTSIQKLLDAHDDYKILVHKVWKQELRRKAKAPVVTLSNASLQSNTSLPATADTVFGYARFYRGQFLQFELDLRFTPQDRFAPPRNFTYESVGRLRSSRQPMEFRIREKRRVKPKSVHYFDHPRFGVIVAFSSKKRK